MKIRNILLFAILVRLLISPFFFHPDIKDIHLRVSYLYTDQVLNIYEFLKQNELTKINAPDFVYPPLAYFLLGGYHFILQPVLGENFRDWLFDFSRQSTLLNGKIFTYLLVLKFPYFLFDLLIGLILYKMVKPEKRALTLFIWFLNPLTLYAVYTIGQFDIIPTFFTLLSLYLWQKKSHLLSGIALGLAAALKSYPLLFVPFYLLSKAKLKEKVLFLSTIVLVYGLTILPFISSDHFRNDVLFSGLSQRIFELQLNLFGIGISVFIAFYILLIFLKILLENVPLWVYLQSALLLVYSISRFHPQWIIWVMPFMVLSYSFGFIKLIHIIFFTISYFMVFIFFGDRFLITGLLSPISSLFLDIPDIITLVSPISLPIVVQTSKILFLVSCSFIIWKNFKTNQ